MSRIRLIVRSWRQELRWRLKKRSWESVKSMSGYKNIHCGERCFIIGNGPSLRKMDLYPLKNEYTFGLNRIYLLFPELGFQTSYYVCVNPLVIEQFADEIAVLNLTQFLTDKGLNSAFFSSKTMFLHSRPGLKFSKKPQFYIYEGATVTYVAMQLAFYMGFKEVILIGVDHNFQTVGDPHTAITSNGADPNHFSPNYFGKGVRWHLPDLQTSEMAYKLARDTFINANRSIVDATVGGKLTVFPKVEFNDLF